jgi:hypothetical protein
MRMRFMVPSLIRRPLRTDVLVLRSFSGQNAGGPTACFTGQPPIWLADLKRNGRVIRAGTEFIPVTRRNLVRSGLKVTDIKFLRQCLFGEDFSSLFCGKIVSLPRKTKRACGCRAAKRKTVWMNKSVRQG